MDEREASSVHISGRTGMCNIKLREASHCSTPDTLYANHLVVSAREASKASLTVNTGYLDAEAHEMSGIILCGKTISLNRHTAEWSRITTVDMDYSQK
jgi:hypothetical protein